MPSQLRCNLRNSPSPGLHRRDHMPIFLTQLLVGHLSRLSHLSLKFKEANQAVVPRRFLVTISLFPHCVRALIASSNRLAELER